MNRTFFKCSRCEVFVWEGDGQDAKSIKEKETLKAQADPPPKGIFPSVVSFIHSIPFSHVYMSVCKAWCEVFAITFAGTTIDFRAYSLQKKQGMPKYISLAAALLVRYPDTQKISSIQVPIFAMVTWTRAADRTMWLSCEETPGVYIAISDTPVHTSVAFTVNFDQFQNLVSVAVGLSTSQNVQDLIKERFEETVIANDDDEIHTILRQMEHSQSNEYKNSTFWSVNGKPHGESPTTNLKHLNAQTKIHLTWDMQRLGIKINDNDEKFTPNAPKTLFRSDTRVYTVLMVEETLSPTDVSPQIHSLDALGSAVCIVNQMRAPTQLPADGNVTYNVTQPYQWT